MAEPKTLYQPTEVGSWIVTDVHTGPVAVGTETVELIQVPEGTIVLDAKLIRTVAAASSAGTNVLTVQTDETTPKVFIGASAVDAEGAAAVTTMETATDGADAVAILRPVLTSNANNVKIKINAVNVLATAVSQTAAQYKVALLLAREIPNTGP